MQVVDQVYDEEAAAAMQLQKGTVCVMLHTGSRGLGHQVGTILALCLLLPCCCACYHGKFFAQYLDTQNPLFAAPLVLCMLPLNFPCISTPKPPDSVSKSSLDEGMLIHTGLQTDNIAMLYTSL